MDSTLAKKTLSLVCLVGLVHLISGIAVLVQPIALLVTPLATLHWIGLSGGYSNGFAGAVMVAAGLMAIIGVGRGHGAPKKMQIILFMPQQILLAMQIISISVALITGKYPDGYVPQGGAWFILTDQAWAWILAVSHSIWLAAFIYGGASRGNSA